MLQAGWLGGRRRRPEAALVLLKDGRAKNPYPWPSTDLFPLPMLQARLSYVFKHAQTTLAQDRADLLELTLHVYL